VLVGKQTNKRIGECDAACAVAAAARRERCQNFACTRIASVRLYTFAQLPRVAQPKVEALAGHWMQSLCGISQQHCAFGGRAVRDAQTERESSPSIDSGEVTDAIAEGVF